MVSRYAETYAAWQRDPLNFWAEAAREIDWIQAPQNIFDAKAGVKREPDEVEQEIVTLVRDKIGPVAAFKIAIVVSRLPKTRSGKILRSTMKKIADGDAWTMPATNDDPAIPAVSDRHPAGLAVHFAGQLASPTRAAADPDAGRAGW